MFLPYDVMADTYPVLRKHKWLTPFFHIIRWTNLFRKKRRDKLRYRAKTLIHASQEEANHINHIKEILGINNTEES